MFSEPCAFLLRATEVRTARVLGVESLNAASRSLRSSDFISRSSALDGLLCMSPRVKRWPCSGGRPTCESGISFRTFAGGAEQSPATAVLPVPDRLIASEKAVRRNPAKNEFDPDPHPSSVPIDSELCATFSDDDRARAPPLSPVGRIGCLSGPSSTILCGPAWCDGLTATDKIRFRPLVRSKISSNRAPTDNTVPIRL